MAVSILRMRPANKILGATVENPAGEKLGRVENLIIDEESGRVVYVVLETKALMGLRTSYHLVPWSLLRNGTGISVYVADIGEGMLRDAPALEEDRLPDLTNPDYNRQVHAYWGRDPYWDTPAAPTGGPLPDALG